MESSRNSLLSRSFQNLAVLLTAGLGLDLPAAAGETLYATGGNGLYMIDPATGVVTEVWTFNGLSINNGGLAYDPSTDTLYATGNLHSSSGTTRLFAIDRHTATITAFPGMSAGVNLTSGGLAIHPTTGVLYATGGNGFQSTALFTIDKTTGAETLVGQNGGQCCVAPFGFNMNGLGFRSDGTLFANGLTLSALSQPDYSHLFTIDLATGLATDIGSHGVTAGRELAYSGLAFGANGTLYSMGALSSSNGGLFSVDPQTGLATPIGDFLLQFGVDGGLAFVPDIAPTIYCTAKTNSQGCVPSIGFTGLPSATSATPFTIAATNVLNQKPGLLLYGYARQAVSFQGGYLCLTSSIHRLPTGSAGGSPLPTVDCSGSYALDFNQRIQSGSDLLLVPGREVQTQYWSRDPLSAGGSGLTNALSFQIGQ